MLSAMNKLTELVTKLQMIEAQLASQDLVDAWALTSAIMRARNGHPSQIPRDAIERAIPGLTDKIIRVKNLQQEAWSTKDEIRAILDGHPGAS